MPTKKHLVGGNKNTKKSSKYPCAKLSSKPSFAQKLGAFLLQGIEDEIFFDRETGFSDKHQSVFGVLPFLHMNITEKGFVKMLNDSSSTLAENLTKNCVSKNLNNTLQKVGYDCQKQSVAGIGSLNVGLVESINNRYNIRAKGQQNLTDILRFMTWQVKNKKIPKASIQWAKGESNGIIGKMFS